jgi:class 3 adenylate cyclase
MEPAQTERRLAAIMIADAVGYSRLMSRDEEGTLAPAAARADRRAGGAAPRAHLRQLGDNIVAEFSGPVEAVRCAAEIQRAMRTLDGDRPKDSRLEFRIGINLGDVIVSGGNLFGDGVNVAARIEAVAQPGGILVTGPVHDQVRGKVEFEFDDLGERRLKNIAQPVALFRARLEGGAGRPVARWRALAIGVAAAAAAAGAIWLWSYNGVGLGNRGERQVILVAPFRPIGADLAERELSDGLHQDVTVALARRGNVEAGAAGGRRRAAGSRRGGEARGRPIRARRRQRARQPRAAFRDEPAHGHHRDRPRRVGGELRPASTTH